MKLVACGTWQCTQARRDGRKNFRKQRASARAIKQARFKIRNEGNRYTEIKKNKQERERNEVEERQMENENKTVCECLPISQVQTTPESVWETRGTFNWEIHLATVEGTKRGEEVISE